MNIQQMDLLYNLVHSYIVDYGLSLHTWRIFHMIQGMGLYISLLNMLNSLDIQRLWYILVDN